MWLATPEPGHLHADATRGVSRKYSRSGPAAHRRHRIVIAFRGGMVGRSWGQDRGPASHALTMLSPARNRTAAAVLTIGVVRCP
jgi:hypothetical protein